jgi:CPA1 family monovalent cation:H+ antiporter
MVLLTTRPNLAGQLIAALLFAGLALAFAHIFLLAPAENWWAILPGGFLAVLGVVIALSGWVQSLQMLGAVLFGGLGLVFLAVVAAGLWASGQEVKGLTADARKHAREVWRMLSYVLNGLVFVLLGLQLRRMISSVVEYDPFDLALYALVLWVLLMVLRIAWVWISAHLRFRFDWGWTGSRSGPDPKRLFLVSWAAVRGSITLATALSVPAVLASGAPFPERDLVVFLAAATIVLTLALNGVPLPWLIRKLAVNSSEDNLQEEHAARAEIARAAIAAVAVAARDVSDPEDLAFAQQLTGRYQGKVELLEGDPAQASLRGSHIALRRRLRLAGIRAERQRLHELHTSDAINDESLRIIEAELDERELVASMSVDRG